ncbi:MAG TPA: class I SAM-dependent methyltransferase [Candidatus Kapabacteria bacterium]|nr:class I SAM-dependent methyltransferase [Candidatus Kapabacteria bacterium]
MNPSNPRNPGSVRPHLYDRYVSTFKSENAALTSSDLAHFYKWCDARYYPHLRQLPASSAILELGCGHGRMLNYLHQKGFTNVKGIDISQEQVDLALRDSLDAECADVFEYLDTSTPSFSRRGGSPTIPGGGYDCVIAIDFVEHFTKEELLRMFESLHAAMKSGAILLLQTPNGEGLFSRQVMYGDLTHETILTPGSLGQLLRATGFGKIQCFECAPIASGMLGIARALLWNIVCTAANSIRRIESHKTQPIWTENFICVAKP